MATQYESLLLFHSTTTDEQAGEVAGRMKGVIEQSGGRVHRTENWGRQKLAYEVAGERKGLYLLLSFEGHGSCIPDLTRICEIEESVLKHMTVALEKPREASPARRQTAPDGQL